MKREIAKIDTILQDNLRMEKSSQKMTEMLLYDNLVKSENNDTVKSEQQANSHSQAFTKTDTPPTPAVAEEETSALENKVPEREFVKCNWRGCGLDVEDMHLL